MFEAVTLLATNKCGMGCKYCSFYNRPIKEASLRDKLKMLRIFASWKDFDKRFICCLGGDILWMEGVEKFTAELNRLGLFYGWQTSAGDPGLMKRVLSLGLKNFSISVDPVPDDWCRYLKAAAGLYWAGRLMQENPNLDVHATIVLDKKNLPFIVPTVRYLSGIGIWTEITVVHWQKGYFDLVPPKEVCYGFQEEDIPHLKEVMKRLIEIKEAGGKVHSSYRWLASLPKYAVNLDWKCSEPRNCVVDADLHLRLCLHVPGKRVRQWHIFDLEKEETWQEFLEDWKKDQEEFCQGCAWDCQYEIDTGEETAGVCEWFAHGK